MSAPLTAVVVVTHGRAGADMLDAAQQILHVQLPRVTAVGINAEDDRSAVDDDCTGDARLCRPYRRSGRRAECGARRGIVMR